MYFYFPTCERASHRASGRLLALWMLVQHHTGLHLTRIFASGRAHARNSTKAHPTASRMLHIAIQRVWSCVVVVFIARVCRSLSVCPRFNAHHANTHTHQEIDAEVARRCDAYETERVTDDASRLQQLQKVRDAGFLMNTQQRCWQQEISNNSTITSRRACAAAAASQRNCAQSFVASCLSLLDALDCLGLRRVPSSPLVVIFLQSICY